MAYMTHTEAEARLFEFFGVEAVLFPGHLRAASANLDSRGRFHGVRVVATQAHEFPRTHTAPGDVAGTVPAAVLDWVALEAWKLSTPHDPGQTSVSNPISGSKSFAAPRQSQADRWQQGLLSPYEAGGAVPISSRRTRRYYLLNDPLDLSGPYAS